MAVTFSEGDKVPLLQVGLARMISRWKTDPPEQQQQKGGGVKSFTQKRGVTIDPINVLGLRRDQSLDSAARRGLFHK